MKIKHRLFNKTKTAMIRFQKNILKIKPDKSFYYNGSHKLNLMTYRTTMINKNFYDIKKKFNSKEYFLT